MARDLSSFIRDLSAEDAATRAAAAEKLNELGEAAAPAAIVLIDALQDTDESVRQFANSALEGCGSPPCDLIDDLEHRLASNSADVAYWAATLLGRLQAGAVQAVESLKSAAASHPAEEVRQRATWALGKIASG
jgi:HEAT repeat protein